MGNRYVWCVLPLHTLNSPSWMYPKLSLSCQSITLGILVSRIFVKVVPIQVGYVVGRFGFIIVLSHALVVSVRLLAAHPTHPTAKSPVNHLVHLFVSYAFYSDVGLEKHSVPRVK